MSGHAARLQQLIACEEVLDAGTVRHLEGLGVGEGWRCLEVGAGAGSIARWLCERVGRSGTVLATDLDIRFVAGAMLHQRNGSVLQHDLVRDDLPQGEFDLVHARLVLAWLSDPVHALAKLVRAVKPGGWLLVEELDGISVAASGDRARHRKFDGAFGRRLHAELESAGLGRVHAEGRVAFWRADSASARLWQLALECLGEPPLQMMSPITVAAWGRRPVDAPNCHQSAAGAQHD